MFGDGIRKADARSDAGRDSPALADLVNAATCLQTGAILVSNDRDFDVIHQAGLIQRLTLSQAIQRWAPSNG